jgi:hypothetical protein
MVEFKFDISSQLSLILNRDSKGTTIFPASTRNIWIRHLLFEEEKGIF